MGQSVPLHKEAGKGTIDRLRTTRENSLRKKKEEDRGLNRPRSNQQTAGAALEISIACHEEYKEKNIPHDEDEWGMIQASRSSGKTRYPTT